MYGYMEYVPYIMNKTEYVPYIMNKWKVPNRENFLSPEL